MSLLQSSAEPDSAASMHKAEDKNSSVSRLSQDNTAHYKCTKQENGRVILWEGSHSKCTASSASSMALAA